MGPVMGLLWIFLPMLLVRAEAENQTMVPVKLGQNVTLECTVEKTVIYWYMEIHSRFRCCIIYSFVEPSESEHWVTTGTTKYEDLGGNRLLIRNITADDCRTYFCAVREDNEFIFMEAFHLVPEANHQPESPQPTWSTWCKELLMYGSLALNALLLLLTGSITYLCLRRKRRYQVEKPETAEAPQYEEIQLPTRAPRPPAPPPECIYYKAQLPWPPSH